MSIFLGFLGMAVGMLMIKFRERIGETLGDAPWMHYVGGVYMMVMLIGIFIFFFSLAKMTGTTDFLLAPLRFLIPVPTGNQPMPQETF